MICGRKPEPQQESPQQSVDSYERSNDHKEWGDRDTPVAQDPLQNYKASDGKTYSQED